MKRQMLLIDGHGLAFRGFYALPSNLAAEDGTPTNAILGFMNMALKALDEWPSEGLGIFFDLKGSVKRRELFADYKEGRKPAPEAFKLQLPVIVELCRAMGFPVFMREGVEADDCIVATAKAAGAEGWEVRILSADKDLFQIIDKNIEVLRPGRGVSEISVYNEEAFEAKYGFKPPLMADYLALVGDAVDNIPGVPGIGDKTAKELVSRYGSLEEIYEHLNEMPKSRRAKLEENKELAWKSRELILPQPTEPSPVSELEPHDPELAELTKLCDRLGLRKILSRFSGIDEKELKLAEEARKPAFEHPTLSEATLAQLFTEPELALVPSPSDPTSLLLADPQGRTTELDTKSPEELEKFALWCAGGVLYLKSLRALAVKYPKLPLPPVENIRDLEAAHYLLHPDQGGEKGLARACGGPLPEGAVLATLLFSLYGRFEPGIKEYGLEKVLTEIDLPLELTLAKMQNTGLSVDTEKLAALEKKLTASLEEVQADIDDRVGMPVNLSSPKQVGELLFEKLHLPPIKKNKTGYSTDASVLEALAALPEPLCEIPKKIVVYREESKINSGFVQPFLKLGRECGGLIHSNFDNLATGTGRLASSDPNVQNMPVFGEWADCFRECFVPSGKGRVFVAADYSQIELRVLAHLTGEPRLIEAFTNGEDVHRETASWVFGVEPEEVTPEQRRFAKVVNFGLLYGMSAFGLAQRLGIPRGAAQSMVDRYFSALPGVKKYLEESAEEAKKRGYTTSVFGRIRPLSEVATIEGRGNNPINRVAVNTPIQSAAADIAKIALFRFDKALAEKFPEAKVVLQIHDSIICECDEKDAEEVEKLLISVMENVCELSVPLKAEPKHGLSLKEV